MRSFTDRTISSPRSRQHYFDPNSPVFATPQPSRRRTRRNRLDLFLILRRAGWKSEQLDRLRLVLRYEEPAVVADCLGIDPGHASRVIWGLLTRSRVALLAQEVRQALKHRCRVVLDPDSGRKAKASELANLLPTEAVQTASLRLPELTAAITRLRDALLAPGALLCARRHESGARLWVVLPPEQPGTLARLSPVVPFLDGSAPLSQAA